MLESLRTDAPDIPLVIVGDLDDETQAIRAVHAGAQDYLVKKYNDSQSCVRALRFAIERQQWREELRAASLKDELTGLYNRRGFFFLDEQHLKLARRIGRKASLVFADLDGLKRINDQFGHVAGDRALHQVGVILKKSFRNSDLIARIGGDEFVVLAMHTAKDKRADILMRLDHKVRIYNTRAPHGYTLTLSVGIAHYDPDHPRTLREMLERADTLMYNQKRKKRDA
ncbi:MAG: diguanylate cyclase [Chloroflexi bacterium]|nr:diguanylate cyclase [Chloroflexota bacterium]